MLVCIRERLLAGDFADALRMLQHYQDNNIPFLTILSTASRLKRDLESKRRGEIPTNPVVKQSNSNQSAANNSAGEGARSASPSPSAQLNAVAEAAQVSAGQFFKSVSNFFTKK